MMAAGNGNDSAPARETRAIPKLPDAPLRALSFGMIQLQNCARERTKMENDRTLSFQGFNPDVTFKQAPPVFTPLAGKFTRLVPLIEGEPIEMKKSPLVFGRGDTCDVVLSSQRVSRAHCMLEQVGDQVILRDLGSTNGTNVNGNSIKSVKLEHDDIVEIGGMFFRAKIGTARAAGGSPDASSQTAA